MLSGNCKLKQQWDITTDLFEYSKSKTPTTPDVGEDVEKNRNSYSALFTIAKTWNQPRCPSIGEWTNKLWPIQTMEYYSEINRNGLSNHEDMEEVYKHISEWKKPIYILYDSNYMTFWKRQNHGYSKKISGCQRMQGEGMNRQSMKEFGGSETLLYDVTMQDTCHCTFVQIHRMSNTKSEL